MIQTSLLEQKRRSKAMMNYRMNYWKETLIKQWKFYQFCLKSSGKRENTKNSSQNCSKERPIKLQQSARRNPVISDIKCIYHSYTNWKSQLTEEQAGFWKGRSWYYGTLSSSVHVLKGNQQSTLISSTSKRLLIVHITRACGKFWEILEKIIQVIQGLYNEFTFSVLQNGNLTPWFDVQAEVKQGCLLSPLLFLTLLDWIMKETTKDN